MGKAVLSHSRCFSCFTEIWFGALNLETFCQNPEMAHKDKEIMVPPLLKYAADGKRI